MGQTVDSHRPASFVDLFTHANWWLISAIAAGGAFWVGVIAAGRAIIAPGA